MRFSFHDKFDVWPRALQTGAKRFQTNRAFQQERRQYSRDPVVPLIAAAASTR